MTLLRKRLFGLYAAGAATVVGAMVVLSVMVVRQQADHARSVAEALYHEDLRIALWRMETRLTSLLASATSRLSDGSLPVPDSFDNGWIDPRIGQMNTKAPPAEALQEKLIAAADLAYQNSESLDAARETQEQTVEQMEEPISQEAYQLSQRGEERSQQEFQWRSESNVLNRVQQTQGPLDEEMLVCVGPLAPVWSEEEEELRLNLARRVERPIGVSHENFELDWSEMETTLLNEVRDLFPTARLVPIPENEQELDGTSAARLAAIPARLEVPPPLAAELPGGYRWLLSGAWIATLIALSSGAIALRASLAYGDRHRRFTHAVTHELRTPLTTFRMYSEMLSRDMVPPDSRAEYLATLEAESGRLSGLVENVLRYARLEEGLGEPTRESLTAGALVDRCVPDLARRCAAGGATLEVDQDGETESLISTDPDAVLQVLANLVDNAIKYGCDGESQRVRLEVAVDDGRVDLVVTDEGPGVPASVAREIFRPFERGGRDSSDPSPGVGLGLALARELAGALGGTLELEDSERGARFRLSLPATA